MFTSSGVTDNTCNLLSGIEIDESNGLVHVHVIIKSCLFIESLKKKIILYFLKHTLTGFVAYFFNFFPYCFGETGLIVLQ